MTDTVITAATKRRELYIWLACFVVANIVNVVTIIKFQTSWLEIFTQIGYVVITSLVLYVLVLIVRLAWRIFSHLLGKR